MHYLIQKSHRFLAIVSPNKHCNVSICDYFYIISIAGRKCFRVSYGYGKDFPPMHGLKLVPFYLTTTHQQRRQPEYQLRKNRYQNQSDDVGQQEGQGGTKDRTYP